MNAVAPLTERQLREIAYHREHSVRHGAIVDRRVPMDIVESRQRRRWNAYWSLYDRLLEWNVRGRHVLVVGCGFGDDAIRLALMGAKVSACDISPDSVEIARERAGRHGVTLDLGVMPAETLAYADDSFDAVVLVDILHHVDIPAAMQEIRRVLRPGGRIFADELYTHSRMQSVRDSRLVAGLLYGRLQRFIYGSEAPYITADEHKINEDELRVVLDMLVRTDTDWFDVVLGRLVPNRWTLAARLDRFLMRLADGGGRFLAGRVVFSGEIRKTA